jgi:hypothetical protein
MRRDEDHDTALSKSPRPLGRSLRSQERSERRRSLESSHRKLFKEYKHIVIELIEVDKLITIIILQITDKETFNFLSRSPK